MQNDNLLALGAFIATAVLGFALFEGLRKGKVFLSPQAQPSRTAAPIMFWLCCGTLGIVGAVTLVAGVRLLLGFD